MHNVIFAIDRTPPVPIHVVFHARGFYDVPRVLIVDARSLRALAAILDRMTHLASMS